MKISQSKVRVEPYNAAPVKDDGADEISVVKVKTPKPVSSPPSSSPKVAPAKKTFSTRPVDIKRTPESRSSSGGTTSSLQRIRAIAQKELELIRRMRAEAEKYHRETAIKARSEAHQLVLHARLATQREVEDMIRQANEEIQKVLADIRVIRITAQEELAAQRKFTDAAKLSSMSLSMKEIFKHSTEKAVKKNKSVTSKPRK